MLEEISPQLEDYQLRKLEQFKLANEKEEKNAIVFTGDSIIEYFLVRKYLGRNKHLINRGIAGTYTQWLLDHIDLQVTDLKPEKVFIQIGTNDIGLGYELDDICDRIQTFVELIKEKSPNTKIYILSLAPVSELEQFSKTVKVRTNIVIDMLNQELSQIDGITFIDINSLLKDSENQLRKEYTVDGLHLSPEGYHEMSKPLKQYLE